MQQTKALPTDIRMMHGLTYVLLVAAGLFVLLSAVYWILGLPAFQIKRISVVGNTMHTDTVILAPILRPTLSEGFWTLNIERVKAAVEQASWVRSAIVERKFPNKIVLTVEEQQPVAFWGEENSPYLLNEQGETFSANLGDLDNSEMVQLWGPENSQQEVLAMYRQLSGQFHTINANVSSLRVNNRGSWSAVLDNGAKIELGSGNAQQVSDRILRFTTTLASVLQRHNKGIGDLESADLRHSDGYALKLKGITTTGQQAASPQTE